MAQGQRYKIWKQFTTLQVIPQPLRKLWLKVKDTKSESNSQRIPKSHSSHCSCGSRSKIQNLKAIHNPDFITCKKVPVVAQGQRYKIWKQFTTVIISGRTGWLLWLKVKDTKSESNSQPAAESCVFPFTLWLKVKDTKSESNSQLFSRSSVHRGSCGSRSKIQNLKAIHN